MRTGRRLRMTLIELLAAAAVLALLTALLFAAGSGIMHSWTRLRNEDARFREVMALDRLLQSLIPNAVPFVWPDPDGQDRLMFRGEPDRLRIAVRRRPFRAGDTAIRFVSLFLRDDALTAAWIDRPDFRWEDAESAQESILARNVAAVNFQYADWDADQGVFWTDEWDPDGERLDVPSGILVVVRWNDGRVESWLFRTSGNGWFERLGRPPKRPVLRP